MSDSFSADNLRAAVALQNIRDTQAVLDGWRVRSRSIETPQLGSELAGDATIWPGFPPHQLARVSLVSGVQHLNMARIAIEAGELYPIAHPTVLRGALLGAARAVWMLAPDSSHDRQQRGLRAVHETHRRYVQFLEGGPPGASPTDLADALTEMTNRRDAIRALWQATGDMSASSSPPETDIVDAAVDYAFGEPKKIAFAKTMWRTHSGDAHGLAWPMFARQSTTATSVGRIAGAPGRMSEYTSGGDLWEVAESYVCCYQLLRRGWSLFDQRCESP